MPVQYVIVSLGMTLTSYTTAMAPYDLIPVIYSLLPPHPLKH